MAVMNTSVRWMHSGMQGAPVIDNNWGDLTAMLRACCVTGFNVRPIQSITCQGTKATIQCAGHGYVEHQVVQIENATPAGYNGAHRVVSVEGANTLTIELESELPEAQAAPGQTLQMRTAPLGFESLFDDGGQKLVLRSTYPQSTKNVLRVDDSLPSGYNTSWAKFGRVTMAQNMSDLDTFIGARAPFDPANPTKNEVPVGSGSSMRAGWFKWHYAMHSGYAYEYGTPDPGARPWAIVSDGRTLYPLNACVPGGGFFGPHHFGDIESLQSPDPFACLLVAVEHHSSVSSNIYKETNGALAASVENMAGSMLLRDYHGEGSPVRCSPRSLAIRNKGVHSGEKGVVPFPNGPGNGFLLHPVWLQQRNGHLRGRLRGMYHVLHRHNFGNLAVIDGVAGLPGRKVLVADIVSNETSSPWCVAFDITGPW